MTEDAKARKPNTQTDAVRVYCRIDPNTNQLVVSDTLVIRY